MATEDSEGLKAMCLGAMEKCSSNEEFFNYTMKQWFANLQQ